MKATGDAQRALPVADEANKKELLRPTIGKWRQSAQTELLAAKGK